MAHFVFLDTGFILALELSDDQHHVKAKKCWASLAKHPPTLITTSYVLDEVVTFFNTRNHHDKAVEVGQALLSSASVKFIHVDPQTFFAGWHYFKKHSDKSYSLTDCISFIVMQDMGCKESLTFDQHFTQAGFTRRPD